MCFDLDGTTHGREYFNAETFMTRYSGDTEDYGTAPCSCPYLGLQERHP